MLLHFMLKYMHNTFNFIGANKAGFFLGISFRPSMQKYIYIFQVYQINTEVEHAINETKNKTVV